MKKVCIIIFSLVTLLSCIELGNPFDGPEWQRCGSISSNIVGFECGTQPNASRRFEFPLPTNFHDSLINNINYQDSICSATGYGQFISWMCPL